MLNEYVNWPGVEQVFQLERQVTNNKAQFSRIAGLRLENWLES